jgi:hypothetical protein
MQFTGGDAYAAARGVCIADAPQFHQNDNMGRVQDGSIPSSEERTRKPIDAQCSATKKAAKKAK